MNFIEPLLNWYRKNARALPWRKTRDAYRIWISEIMLQQTRVEAVKFYYARFLAACPDVYALAAIDDDALNKLWEGLGYYTRARNLKKTAQVVVSEFDGVLPKSDETLLTLPGIGAYTAGAVASIAYNIPVPAVDGNVLRVMARLFDDPAPIDDAHVKQRVRDTLLLHMPKDCPGAFNQAMMELGATVCVPNGAPHCDVCPVSAFCLSKQNGTQDALPVKSAKKPRRIEEKTVFVLTKNGCPVVCQRPDRGLLASLFQLPDTAGRLSPEQMAAFVGDRGGHITGEIRIYDRRHIFTHVEWRMRVFSAEASFSVLPDGWQYLTENHALPTAYRICLDEPEAAGGAT